MEAGAGDRQVVVHGLLGDAAQDMDAELQSLPMQPVGQRLEDLTVCRRRKSGQHRQQHAVAVQQVLAHLLVLVAHPA